MANEWVISEGKACYDSATAGYILSQPGVLTVDELYYVKVTISNMTQGRVFIPSFDDLEYYTEDGTYEFISFAAYTDILIYPDSYGGLVFDGCVEVINAYRIPLYSIKDCNDNTVFELTDSTGVTALDGYVQYQIDWSGLDEGIYYIEFQDSTLTYRTDCFNIKTTHSCTLRLTWNCNENAWDFNYGLDFTQSLRLDAKLWKPKYKALDKEVFEYSDGEQEILYVTKAKEEILTIGEAPGYIHDAVSLAIDSDNFYIDGAKYVYTEDEYSPSWRNSSQLAPSEVALRRSQSLRNVNCG